VRRSLPVLAIVAVFLAMSTMASAKPVLERISVGPAGQQANGFSILPKVSDDGTVAWQSTASNLAQGDLNGSGASLFARAQGFTRIVGSNLAPDPALTDDELGGISDSGRYVVFTSWAGLAAGDTNALPDVYLRDLRTGSLRWVSQPTTGGSSDNWSIQGSISGDGRWVAFASAATNLVPGGSGSGTFDIFVRDLRSGVLRRVASSAWTPDLDLRGRTVAFVHLGGANLVYVLDLGTGVSQVASVDNAGRPGEIGGSAPALDANGDTVVFSTEDTLDPGDTVRPGPFGGGGSATNVYVRDLRAGTTEQVDLSSTGEHADSVGNAQGISDNGRWVAFVSSATNLVPGDTNSDYDVFVRDRRRGTTERVSVTAGGAEANGGSYDAWLSPNGRLVAFSSFASNLVPGDTNGFTDVFLRRLRH
jgi:TolB protein